jgi:hypothetical protein
VLVGFSAKPPLNSQWQLVGAPIECFLPLQITRIKSIQFATCTPRASLITLFGTKRGLAYMHMVHWSIFGLNTETTMRRFPTKGTLTILTVVNLTTDAITKYIIMEIRAQCRVLLLCHRRRWLLRSKDQYLFRNYWRLIKVRQAAKVQFSITACFNGI